MTTKEATCAERIAEQLASEEESLREIFADMENYENDEARDQAYEDFHSYALGMTTRQQTIFTLSWGGPASSIEVTHEGADIISAVYRFSDWFDTATEQLDEESPLYRYAQDLINIQEEAI